MTPERIAELRRKYCEELDSTPVRECLDAIERLMVERDEMEVKLAEAYDDADGWKRTAQRLASEVMGICAELLEHDGDDNEG